MPLIAFTLNSGVRSAAPLGISTRLPYPNILLFRPRNLMAMYCNPLLYSPSKPSRMRPSLPCYHVSQVHPNSANTKAIERETTITHSPRDTHAYTLYRSRKKFGRWAKSFSFEHEMPGTKKKPYRGSLLLGRYFGANTESPSYDEEKTKLLNHFLLAR